MKKPEAASTTRAGGVATSPPAIVIRDLWVSFGGWNALEGIDLEVPQGRFLGLIGPNGAGKSVLLKVLLGLIEPDRGTVRILGRPPGRGRGDVAYVPQRTDFDPRFPIRVIDVVLMGRLARAGLFRRYGAEDVRAARSALETVGLSDVVERQIGRLSGGQLQRVLIARALAVDARVLLLDEPTSNLDSGVAGRLYELLHDLAGSLTIVLVDHDIGVMSRYVESVGCLNRRLFQHEGKELSQEVLEQAYGYPVEVVVHGHLHRVLDHHETERD